MTYIEFDKLTVLELGERKNTIPFDAIKEILIEKPSNVIYCETEGQFYGIISMGDVARADEEGADYVVVNRNFTRVLPEEYMKVRSIFHEKEHINALPVVNEKNKLLGAYVRWDNVHCGRFALDEMKYFFMECSYVVFVKPCEIYCERYKLFNVYYKYFENIHGGICASASISYSEIEDYVDIADLILFTDEEELRGIDTLIRHIFHKNFTKGKLQTYGNLVQELKYRFAGVCLRDIKQRGVHVLNLVFRKENDYGSALRKRIRDKFAALGEKAGGEVPSAMYPCFFDELYTKKYADSIMHLSFSVESEGQNGKLKDCTGEFYNVINGERYTVGQPNWHQKTIYFVGPCFIYGHYVEDKNTIESLLQVRVNDTYLRGIKVVNCGSLYSRLIELELARIKGLPLKRGDCIVTYIDGRSFSGVPELDLMEILEKNDVSADWMIDDPAHCNHKINALYAMAVYDELKPVLANVVDGQGEKIGEGEDFVKTVYIDRYFSDFIPSMYEKIGSIVMNCNPFTYGHRYLIEEALRVVDFLIIFVVEEDKSLFSFEERFAMVYDGVEDFDNVKVVPSGSFILSQRTFPEYFIKESDEDIAKNAENDIITFAKRIAPALNISYRFVGEELEDAVTNEYNLAMKRILPQNGIKLVEIPRKRIGGTVYNISASLVRKCLEEQDWEQLSNLIPQSTWKILFSEDCGIM